LFAPATAEDCRVAVSPGSATRIARRVGYATGFSASARARFCLASIERVKGAIGFPADKDSEPRQRRAIERFAKSAGYEIVDRFNDPAESGADPIVRLSSSRLTISIVRF
jgi:hypothetical protein